MKSSNRPIFALMAVLGLTLAQTTVQADPTPFRAEYHADYKGLPVSATGVRELTVLPDGHYRFSSTARSFFASISEQTLFSWEDGAVPIKYQYSRKGLGKNRQDVIAFDHSANLATYQDRSHDIGPATLDKLLYQIRMREDLLQAHNTGSKWPAMHYEVADRGQLRQYDFEIVGEEVVETRLGRFNTVKAIRVRNDDDRKTAFWLAPDYDFLLVRFEQIEPNGKGFTLLLKKAEFDGKPVRGF